MKHTVNDQPSSSQFERQVRPATLAGTWYPADPGELSRTIDQLLASVEPVDGAPAALVAPHAGYAYSGKIAATAWRQLERAPCDLAVILAPAHGARPSKPLAVWDTGAFATPLGEVPVDTDACRALIEACPAITADRASHLDEHAIEIQLPFLQRVCPNCRIVPMVMGENDERSVDSAAQALASVLGNRRAVIVASSDLSHYPSYRNALAVDQATLAAVETGQPDHVREAILDALDAGTPHLLTCACGEGPILVAMRAAALRGADSVTVLDYANSGDAPSGDRKQVVGYGAVMFWRYEPPALGEAQQALLLRLAREAIDENLQSDRLLDVRIDDPALNRQAGAFVTLWQGDELRGCIGHLKADRPLHRAVREMAVSAATSDTRFDPLSLDELSSLRVEISVLSPLRRITNVEQVQVGTHGLVITKNGRRGLLLPEVATERGWDRYEFADAVCWKAGLPDGCWRDGATMYTFTAIVFSG